MLKKLTKFALFLLKYALYLLSHLFPRSDKIWVFGAAHDKFVDNPKFYYLWVSEYANDIRPIWISGSAEVIETLRARGYEAYRRWSIKGIFITLRSGVFVYSSYLGDVNFFTSGTAFRVNLWHGVGLKKIEFKIKEGALKNFYNPSIINKYRFILPDRFARPKLMLSTSPLMTEHFSECFRISKDKCFEGIYPRLAIDQDLKLRQRVSAFGVSSEIEEMLRSYGRRIIYMPTWRDSMASGIDVAIPDYKLLNDLMVLTGSVFVIKAHPNEFFDKSISGLSNVMLWDNCEDVYPFLTLFDVLVTDYSSVLYDFVALGKRSVILYTYDYDQYVKYSREFAYEFDDYTTGSRVNSFSCLCDLLGRDKIDTDSKYEFVRDSFWRGSNCIMSMHLKICSQI